MTIYEKAIVPVRKAIENLHENQVGSLVESGTWLTGSERSYLAKLARAVIQGQEYQRDPSEGQDENYSTLNPASEVVAQVAAGGKHITRETLEDALRSGLSEEEYVESVGVAARAVCLDTFCEGIGIPVLTLGTPSNQTPTRKKSTNAASEGAWLKTIPSGPQGGSEGSELYGELAAPFIFRALSLVPEEARHIIDLVTLQYVPGQELMNFKFSYEESFGRRETELVAGRTSAINECFY